MNEEYSNTMTRRVRACGGGIKFLQAKGKGMVRGGDYQQLPAHPDAIRRLKAVAHVLERKVGVGREVADGERGEHDGAVHAALRVGEFDGKADDGRVLHDVRRAL